LVPAYKTGFVWPIGSGDVFVSVFTFQWALNGKPAAEAADLASRAAAFYCDRRSLDFGGDAFKTFNPKPFRPKENGKPAEVYLAGPFFSMSQNWLIEEAFRALEDRGLIIFQRLNHIERGSPKKVNTKNF